MLLAHANARTHAHFRKLFTTRPRTVTDMFLWPHPPLLLYQESGCAQLSMACTLLSPGSHMRLGQLIGIKVISHDANSRMYLGSQGTLLACLSSKR
jgi:hypothetical protein